MAAHYHLKNTLHREGHLIRQERPAGRPATITHFFHLAIDCSARTAVFAWFPTLTGQIDIVQPANGGMIFIMRQRGKELLLVLMPSSRRLLSWDTSGIFHFCFSLVFSVKLNALISGAFGLGIFSLFLRFSYLAFLSFHFFSLQDKFSGTYCFLKMSLFTANVIYHNNPTETKSPASSNASKETWKSLLLIHIHLQE